MKRIHILILAVLLAFVAVCTTSCSSGLKLSHDYDRSTDFSAYKTFSMYEFAATPNVNPFNAERIVNAIRSEMIKKGYFENNKNPDLLISALTVVENKQAVTATGNGGWYRPYRNMDFQTVDYKEGTLVIHIADHRSQKLLWEGSAWSEINKRPKDMEKTIGQVISKILEAYPDNKTTSSRQASLY